MKRLLSIFIAISISIAICPQTESVGKRIASIKKDTNYISAEAVDATEDTAYSNAKTKLDELVDQYIEKNGLAENAHSIIVKDIGEYVSQLTMVKGRMHRVFLYVKRSDIIQSQTPVEIIEIVNHPEEQASIKTEENVTDSLATVAAKEIPTSLLDSVQVKEKVEPSSTHIDSRPTTAANNYLASLSPHRRNVYERFLSTTDFNNVPYLLQEEVTLQNIRKYGVYQDCPDVDKCHWIVQSDEGITILTPMKNGSRINVRTGNADSLKNYQKGIWFRM